MDSYMSKSADYRTNFLLDSHRLPSNHQSSTLNHSTGDQTKQKEVCRPDTQQRENIHAPPMFSIDYILNLAVREQQNQLYQQCYLPHLANLQRYQQQQQRQPDNQRAESVHAQDCRKKKSRTVFTKPQVRHLESVFQIKKYLTCFERSQLASSMILSETQVKIWFQNRRNKFKREHKISHLGVGTIIQAKL